MARIRRLLAWMRADLRLVAELAAIGILILVFLKIAHETTEFDTDNLDEQILLALRNTPDDPIGPAKIEAAVMHISALGSGAVTGLLILIFTLYFALAGRWRYALLMLATALGTLAAMGILKWAYGRERPTIVTQIDPPGGLSFPSGHSMIAMALYLTLGMLLAQVETKRRLKIFVISTSAVLALMIGFSRMYLGVHWPSDVLAGWTAGATWALICGLAIRRIGSKKIEGEQAPEATDEA
jgi:undecaprenyl-diphosphatase